MSSLSTKAPSPTAILTTTETARWLRISTRSVERHFTPVLPGRYLVAHVLARLEELREQRARRRVSA